MDWGDGAGFMNDSVVDEPQQATGNVSVAGEDRTKILTAVSVSQITKLTRPNEGLILHGKKTYHLSLVGFVYEIVDVSANKIHILVDDHSGGGPLEITFIAPDAGTADKPDLAMFDNSMDEFNGDRSEARDIRQLKVGDYVRCVGVAKYSQDKATIVAYSLKILDDPNLISLHILEVIRDSLLYQNMQTSGGSVPTLGQAKQAAQPFHQQQAAGNIGGGNEFGTLSTRDKHILTFLKQNTDAKGMHVDEMCKQLRAFTRKDILESLTTLNNEGLCWQSDDEDIWCVN